MFMAEAPVHLVFLAYPARSSRVYGRRGANLYSIQDATIAATFSMLAAHALGYGTCWVGAFDDEKVLNIVRAPKDRVPVAIITIGKPRGREPVTPRLGMGEFVFNGVHGAPFPHKISMKKLLRPKC